MSINISDQIEKRKIEKIVYDVYNTKIEELENWYKKWLLKLNPIYQRNYRWPIDKKTKLIESIFLWLPLPAIFLFHDTETDTYDVIDWLQRISTILEFLWNEWIDADIPNNDKIYNKWLKINNEDESFSFIDDLLIWKVWIDKWTWINFLSEKDLKIFKEYRLTLIVIDDILKLNHYIFYILNRWWLGLNDQEIRNNFMLSKSKIFYISLEWVINELIDNDLLNYKEEEKLEYDHYYFFTKFYLLFYFVYEVKKWIVSWLDWKWIDDILMKWIKNIKPSNKVTIREKRKILKTFEIAKSILDESINKFNITTSDFILHWIYYNYEKLKEFDLTKPNHIEFKKNINKYLKSKDFTSISSWRKNTIEKLKFWIEKWIYHFSLFK